MKRPGWVWLICTFYCFSLCWTVLSFYLIFSGRIPVTPAQRSYFEGFTALDWASTVLVVALNATAAVFLFLLRRQCVRLFGAGLILGISLIVWHVLTKGYLAAMPAGGGFGQLIGIAIQLGVFLYSRRLAHRGVLT